MQQNPQPPTILNRLKQIQGELAALVSALDRPAPSVPDERGQRGQAGSRPALLQNPFVGYIDNVTTRPVPARKGGTVNAYSFHTGAAKFETFNENQARVACAAIRAGEPVILYWSERKNGRYTNYDVKRVERKGVAHG